MTIDIIKEILEFSYFNNDLKIGHVSVGEEISFPTDVGTISSNRKISFYIGQTKETMIVNIVQGNDDALFFKFEEIPFSKEDLIYLSKLLDFKTHSHLFHKNILMGSLDFINKEYMNRCFGMICKFNLDTYLIVYASRQYPESRSAGEDYYGDNIFYIHKICKIEASLDFMEIILKKN